MSVLIAFGAAALLNGGDASASVDSVKIPEGTVSETGPTLAWGPGWTTGNVHEHLKPEWAARGWGQETLVLVHEVQFHCRYPDGRQGWDLHNNYVGAFASVPGAAGETDPTERFKLLKAYAESHPEFLNQDSKYRYYEINVQEGTSCESTPFDIRSALLASYDSNWGIARLAQGWGGRYTPGAYQCSATGNDISMQVRADEVDSATSRTQVRVTCAYPSIARVTATDDVSFGSDTALGARVTVGGKPAAEGVIINTPPGGGTDVEVGVSLSGSRGGRVEAGEYRGHTVVTVAFE
ncbi:hypothetical protein J1G36_27420 [Pseudomonas carnis]|uniref:MrpH family fimbial adhesin n=1 Tax=Pseudomonas TaxID=286 RepID=UPI000F57297D|nr:MULTISPECIES: hypothetical protein [Pseudomonas]MBY8955613.1 hypothetical protein [Pseudomonas carnis]